MGESAVTVAPFFESVGQPSKPFWVPASNKVILWESQGAGEKDECLKVLQKKSKLGYMGKANPKDKGEQCSVNTADASSRVSIRSPKMTVNTMKEHYEEGTSQELEAGGNGEMCQRGD